MKLIVGLGNPGEKYIKTRHNIGFRIVEVLADQLGLSFNTSPKLFGHVAKSQDILILKPQTFMNDSGRSVRAACDYFNIDSAKDLVVVHDDLDLEFGAVKIQQGTGPKVHNGRLSIYQHLGNQDFLHIRVGVDNRAGDRSIPGADYILASFKPEEEKTLQDLVTQIVQKLLPYTR